MRTIFEETRIGGVTLRNRLVRSATWEAMATDEGFVSDRLIRVYEELARGEVGLLITGLASVLKDEQLKPRMMAMYDDRFVEDYRRLTQAVHACGGRIALQIAYGGTQTDYRTEGRVIWGPSAVAERSSGVVAHEMSRDDIRTLVAAFGAAAARAKAAGFDAVQLHGAHGFLLSQFLSPYHNRRRDEYGGSVENRARLLVEVYEEVRGRVGPDVAVLVKVNTEDFVEGGASFDDCRYVCRRLSGLGIDAIEVSGGINAAKKLTYARPKIDSPEKEAYFARQAAVLAEENTVPILLVGGLRSIETVERLLATTAISGFAMARPFLTEPHLARRWREGDRSKAACVSCNRCRHDDGNVCVVHRAPL